MIIGLDIGTYSVKAVVLDPKKRYQVVEYGEERLVHASPGRAAQAAPEPAPQPGGLAEASEPTGEWEAPVVAPEASVGEEPWVVAVGALLSRLPESDSLITALPWGKALTLSLDVPFADRAKVARILPSQIDGKLPMSRSEVVFDFIVQPVGAEAHEALVGFAQRSDMRHFLESLSIMGANPMIVGAPELMLRYLAEAHIPEYVEGGSFALMDMGHEFTRVLICQAGRVVLARTMSVGGEAVTRQIMEVFRCDRAQAEGAKHGQAAILSPGQAQDPSRQALSDAITAGLEPLVRDLRRTFQALYASERVELSKVYITGGASRITNLSTFLMTEFGGVVVEPLALAGKLDVEQALGQDALDKMPMALSLAMQQVRDRARTRLVDLRQEPFTYRGRSSYLRSQLTRLAAAALMLLVLLGVALFMKKRDLDTQRDAMRASVEQETRKVFGAPVWRPEDIKSRVEESGGEKGGFVPKMSAYEVFYQLTSQLDSTTQLVLSRIEVDADRNLIQIYGKTNTPQAVDKIVSDLEQLKCLKSIKKDKLQVRSDTEVNFELQISSGCS